MHAVKSCFLYKTIGDCEGAPERETVRADTVADIRNGIRVAAVAAVKQISTRISLRPKKRCYPRD
jgi:hypothetical protein